MKPDETNNGLSGAPLLPQGSSSISLEPDSQATHQAAAQVVRGQIDSIFDTQSSQQSSVGNTVLSPVPVSPIATPLALQNTPINTALTNPDVNPYDRTHVEHVDPQVEKWQKYHSAWQTYYQKYYEGYYTHHLHKAQEALDAHAVTSATQTGAGYFSQPQPAEDTADQDTDSMDTEEALFDLRQKLLSKVKSSASTVRKSRHFVPITSAVIVLLIFAFLQYNQILIANVMAYVSPGNIDPQNIVVDPTTAVSVDAAPKLIIPKINVDVPVTYDIGNDYSSQMAAMANGVAWFGIPGAESHPGQVGNTVIAGHSSNDLLDKGDYKFIFAQLDKLSEGDTIYANYNSVRYTYVVTKKEVVPPTDVSALVYPTTKPVLTLLTCTPLGTALNRLLITAEQVSPDPSGSTAAPTTTSTATTSIPGTSPTVLEKLFGAKS